MKRDYLTDIDKTIDYSINSEQDLLEWDEGEQQFVYIPLREEHVNAFKEQTIRLKEYVISCKHSILTIYNEGSHSCLYFCIYLELSRRLYDYLLYIRKLHHRARVTIYKNKYESLLNEFESNLQQVLDDFITYQVHTDEERFIAYLNNDIIPDLEQLAEIIKTAEEKSQISAQQFKDFGSEFFTKGCVFYLSLIKHIADNIKDELLNIYRMNYNNRNNEYAMIYKYLEKEYQNKNKKSIIEKYQNQITKHFNDRCINATANELRKYFDELENESKVSDICNTWLNEVNELDYVEKLTETINRQQYVDEDYRKLFEFQIKHTYLKGRIAERTNYERNGDPMFSVWVDVEKLQRELEFWINAYVSTQERWIVVWSLLKYSFDMIRQNIELKDFVERMNKMFPNHKKACKYESIRKIEKQYAKHYTKWNQNVNFYNEGKNLYDKLSKKEKFIREM